MSVNGIKVTDVIIHPVKKNHTGPVKAMAKINLNDQFVVSNIKVVDGKHGLFIGFPQEYNKEQQKGHDICFPITSELRTYIRDQVLTQYKLELDQTPAH